VGFKKLLTGRALLASTLVESVMLASTNGAKVVLIYDSPENLVGGDENHWCDFVWEEYENCRDELVKVLWLRSNCQNWPVCDNFPN
jgi:hypothetical protein